MFESAKTSKGNIGISVESQEAADIQARYMDANGCRDCRNCRNCRNCRDCRDCYGVLRWAGPVATKLLAINGLYWPVVTDGENLQIGCQQHTVKLWDNFGDSDISCMDCMALEFWTEHKSFIMSLVAARAKIWPKES